MMEISYLKAISPVDGRYGKTTEKLGDYFSEAALIKYRVLVEVEYFIALCELPLPQLKRFDRAFFKCLRGIYESFWLDAAQRVKEIEKITNHDVKAVEYFIKDDFEDLGFNAYKEFVHFGLTSQDITNTAVPLSLKEAWIEVLEPALTEIDRALTEKAIAWKEIPMLARTHGQPASPTTVGKEIFVFCDRLRKQIKLLRTIPFSAKFGGATGNFNAHRVAYPHIDWTAFADNFVNNVLGLDRSRVTTQIDHYDNLAAFFDALKRINTILIDLNRDMWSYISMDYFKQEITDGEVGSSTMPHKVNPIDFENSEGNLGIANAIFEHLSAKLPVSRLQRDLTDSTVIRNVGVPIAHSLIAWKSLLRALGKLILNEEKIRADLRDNWAVVSEGIQTILRREGYPQPYEALKGLTRTHSKIDQETIAAFIETLDVSGSVREELRQITPENYTGIYRFLDDEAKPDETLIKGQAASSGIAEGRATVVKALGDIKVMDGETILVCPSVSRDLVPFFTKLMALVTDTGGVLAPAATVAREYGIPTVVGTSCATDLINDGDIVRVDGAKGHIEIIEKAQ